MTYDELELLKDVFEYNENSTTCLKWKINYYVGNPASILRAWPGKDAGSLNLTGYYRVKYKDIFYSGVHRLVWALHNGPIDSNQIIDHINGVKTDNRICNLRLVSAAVNTRNSKKSVLNTSGVTGVGLHNDTYWKAQWYDENRKLNCKYFSIKKFGNDTAFKMAMDYRENMISLLNDKGLAYSERHGK